MKRLPGWDPSARERPDERLNAALVADKAASVYAHVGDCPECVTARRELGDDTALCDTHFAAALG